MNHLPFTIYHKPPKGQVMLEFAFCMIILFLMMYAIIMIFRWVGVDLGQRQQAHETALQGPIDDNYGRCVVYDVAWSCLGITPVERGPLSQIDPYFYTSTSPMNAVWEGN